MPDTVNRSDLIKDLRKRIIDEIGYRIVMDSDTDASRKIVKIIGSLITGYMKDGKRLNIQAVGVFQVKPRAERMGRNPRTGESITIPSGNVVRFKASKAITDIVNPKPKPKKPKRKTKKRVKSRTRK